jgi:outer membrane protein assembly factor BamB
MHCSRPGRYLLGTILVLFLNGTIHAKQAAWPQFRGPGGLGIAPDDQAYPAELDISRNLLWKTKVSKGHSSPCIWGNSIFITACSGNVLETLCIDRGDGKIKWRQTVEPQEMEKINNMNSYASPTPACDGKRVYVYFGSLGLLVYDFEGKEVWRKALPVPQIEHCSAASPILANRVVVISCDQPKAAYLLAVDRDTGDTVWQRDRPNTQVDGYSTPAFWKHGELEELIVLCSQQLISYDPKDGQERWRLRGLANWTNTTPVYTNETLFAAATDGPLTGDPVNPLELPDFNELLASYDRDGDKRLTQSEIPDDLAVVYRIGPVHMGLKNLFSQLDADKDGALSEAEWKQVATALASARPEKMDTLVAIRSGAKGDASESQIKWRANEGVGQVPSPLVYRQRLYVVKEGGIVTCFNADTGERVYSGKLGPKVYFNASPVAGDGKIYICSQPGTVIVLKAGDEFTVLARNRIGERINATPALMDGRVYVRTEDHVFAFGGK